MKTKTKIKIKNKRGFFVLKPINFMAFFVCLFLLGFFNGVCAREYENEIIYKLKNDPEIHVIKLDNEEKEIDYNIKQIEFKTKEEIEIIEPNYKRQILVDPNDYYYYYQWHLTQSNGSDIDADKAWDFTKGKKKTIVAIIDTGVDIDHEDLIENIWENKDEIAGNKKDDDKNGYVDDVHGWDFVNDDKNTNPDPDGLGSDVGVTHGSHVAGIVAAKSNNDIGVAGVCWNCQIMPVQVMSDEGIGTISSIYEGIMYAVDNGADIINLSFGSYDYSAIEEKAINAALAKGVVVVAAAGNNNYNLNNYPIYPGCNEGVLTVASTNKNDGKASFSNYGKDCVDISAPGSYILSTLYVDSVYGFTSEYGYMSGTSMATPVVAGVIGLLKSYSPNLSEDKIISYLKNNAQKEKSLTSKMGKGRVDAGESLKVLSNSRPTKPGKIQCYTNKNKKKIIQANKISNDATPFFTWKKAETDYGKISGYYVYWGKKKKANPKKKGVFVKKKKYNITGKKKIKAKKKTVYYLIIKAKNSSGKISTKTRKFKYIYKPN